MTERESLFPCERFMHACCALHLFVKPASWRGHTTYCSCGTLLVLRGDEWKAS